MTLQDAVSAAVAALFAERGTLDPLATHAAFWPYVQAAATPYAPSGAPAGAAKRDRRVRRWQYVARFWNGAGELIAETDPEVMDGTGNVPDIVAFLAEQLHDFVPVELHPDATREKLPQLRNNLGRGKRAVLRLPYADGGGAAHICQMDIHRLEE